MVVVVVVVVVVVEVVVVVAEGIVEGTVAVEVVCSRLMSKVGRCKVSLR